MDSFIVASLTARPLISSLRGFADRCSNILIRSLGPRAGTGTNEAVGPFLTFLGSPGLLVSGPGVVHGLGDTADGFCPFVDR